MSDFFIPTNNTLQNNEEEKQNTITSTQDYRKQRVEEFKQRKQERINNYERYGVDVPDEVYDVYNKIVSKAASPEEAQELAYKLGSATKYSKEMGIDILEAFQKVDAYNEALFPDLQDQKGRFEALSDMFTLGNNNVKIGELGQKLMKAQREGDTELEALVMDEINAINQRNELLQDNTPRSWVMEALEAGAQSLPFTGYVAGAGIVGNFIAPAVGTGAAFATSSYLAAGQEYVDMLANGASPETARIVANVSGGIQGLIEADFGITKGILKGSAKLLGKEALKEAGENTAKKSLEEIGRKVFKRFHFGEGKKLLINYLENYGKNVLGEGTEEFLQEITSIVGQEVAASLEGYDIPDDDFKDIVKQTTEAFRGGVLGALSMGFIPAGINGAADIKEYKIIKDSAEAFESPEMFKDVVKDSPVFEGMSDTAKNEVIRDVWERAQARKAEYANEDAKAIAETTDYAEGAEERNAAVDENGEEIEAEPESVYREDNGKLHYAKRETINDDGTETVEFAAGDETKENGRYGRINYTLDKNNKTVTINEFKMAPGREGLRGELFDEFSRNVAGYNVEWNTTYDTTNEIKESLIENNPSGSKNGLNYYADENAVADASTRAWVDKQVDEHIYDFVKVKNEKGEEHYVKTKLSKSHRAAAVALLEAAAKRQNMSLTEYVNKTFGNEIFGDTRVLQNAALAQAQKDIEKGIAPTAKAGGVDVGIAQTDWKKYGQQVKAVIYAGEHADFSTWAHELAHIFQNQLEGDLKTQAENAFGVKDGDWINSEYTFANGKKMPAAEAFAYGFQDWLKTGKAENEQMKNIFKEFAKFIAQAYNSLKKFINLTPEITSVYEQLLSGDDSLLKAAEMAVEEDDRRYRAEMKRQAEESEQKKAEEAEQQKKAEEAEREEASETTEFEEEEKELTPEEAEKNLQEAGNETKKTDNAIDNALENSNLTDTQKTEIADVLKDENSTVEEKAAASTEAASSVYDDEDTIDPNLFFQLAGEPSIRRMAESEERERILADLEAAQLLDDRYKSMDAASKASRIRMMTGWEKDASGNWKFELDDSINRIKTEVFKNNPEILTDSSAATLLNLGDILEAPELYKVFPYMKNVRVSFYSDPNAFRAVLTPQGIKVNTRYLKGMNGETGLKGVLAHEIQHIIQAMEFAESKGIQGENIEQLYNDMMAAMQAAGERKYDYDLTSLQNGLDAYMKDAGEIEARNVARRILMNADQRRMNTLASTEDVKRLQFMNEADANEVETQEDYVRKQYEGTDQWLKAPNGQPTKLTEKQWCQTRTINFKRWFGNWELSKKVFNVIPVTKAEFNTRDSGIAYAENNGIIGLMSNEETGGKGPINISKQSVGEMLNEAQRMKSPSNDVHYAVLKELRQIIKESELVDSHPDYKKNKDGKRTPQAGINENVNIDVMYGAINFDGKTYRVRTTIKRFIDPNAQTKAYAYSVEKIEVLVGTLSNDVNATAPRISTSITGNILLQGVRKVNQKDGGDGELALDDYSKVLDENGEPLVLYHGTNTDFDVFDGKNNFHFGTKKQAELRINDYKEYLKQEIEDLTKRIKNATSQTDKFNAMNALENAKSKLEGFKNPKLMEVFLNARNLKETEDENLWQEKTEKYKAQGYDGFKYYNVYENDGNYSYAVFSPEQIKSATDNNGNFDAKNPNIYFQEVFHGSPHNFEKFSTENIGTGEGAQAFGWGLYFTNQESFASFYADKLANEPKRISLIAKNEYLKSRKKSLKDVENKEKYEAKIIKNINHFKKELKQAQKAGDESEIKFYQGLIDDSIKQLDDKERLSYVEAFEKDIAKAEQEIAELKASMKNNRNLYTVEIPDEGYLVWDKNVSPENIEGIKKALKDKGITDFTRLDNLIENQKKWESDPNSTYTFGSNIYKVISDYLGSDKAASLFLKDLGYIGIDYPANSLSGYTSQDERNYVIFDEANANIKKHLLYQNAYHGSGADFDKFDTENYGFSGEGSMSFGYGTYVTDNEDIARDYADRQVSQKYANIDDPYIVLKTNVIATIRHEAELKGFNKALENRKEFLQHRIEDPQGLYTDEQKENSKRLLEELKTLTEDDIHNRHLYTVEIPDDIYIQWDKPVRKQTTEKIKRELLKEIYSNPDSAYFSYDRRELSNELDQVFSYVEGMQLYNNVSAYLEGDKAASKFLHKIGYAGIKYPAGTIHGNGNGAYNYVIFNDDDVRIVNHLFYQTEAELQDEARSFDSWQDFMEYCEVMHSADDVSPIPYNADAQWYQSFYETAHGIQTEQEKNEQTVADKINKEGLLPGAADALFATYIKSTPEMVDNFLKAVADLDAIDLNSDEWARAETQEDAQERERIDELKTAIDIILKDYNWQSAMKRVQGGHEISEGLRKRLIGEMLDNFKVRDFRALYSEVMDDAQFAVSEEDSTAAMLTKKLSKYKNTYDILKPGEDVSRTSPERRKQIAQALQNRELAEKIRNGSLKLDDEVDAYFKSLTKQIKEKQKQLDELEAETQADYQRIADAERRKLLKLHDELLRARTKLTKRNAEVERKINKGLKITEKYSKQSQNLKADYDEIFRKFTDLKNTIQITAEVQAALDRQEAVAGLKEDINNKQKEKNLTAEIKKMRIQLVKRAMRRVPFNRIDYENARTVIAIQRMLEPNLMGGVNRFIGIDSAFLRGVISGIVTDADYKEKILNYLRKQSKSSQAFVDFLKKVEDLKSIKDFDSWTAKERKYAIKHLPKENWVRDLNLQQLAKEREESIDLDIDMKEKQVPRIDPKTGDQMTDKEGRLITETAFVLDASDELKKLVKDAVGADMFDIILNKPFAEWTTEELENLAKRIDELYTEGREMKSAKDEARRREYDSLRKRIEDAVKETGITINDDDTPEEKERKQKKIDEILGLKSGLAGTEAGKNTGIKAKFDRLIHGYWDANVLRVSRILDNQSEGDNVRLLYRMEDDCFNAKTRSILSRSETVKKVMADNKITEASLAESIKVPGLDTEFTVDELLYFLAADKDFEIDEKKAQKAGLSPLDMNDDYAATSRNAVMFGNMMSDSASQEMKEQWLQMDRDMQEAIENDTLTVEQRQALTLGMLDKKPGTSAYIAACHAKWETVLGAANSFINEHPEYNALLEAIEADYAEQYGRMNEVSINEFNMPVHRVKAYVPLVRRESNGDTNVNQVKEDLLGAFGGEAGKQWVNKGMTQRRQNISPLNQKPVQTGLFRTWGDSIDRTEHFIAYAPYVRMLNAVYKSRDASYTRRFIESRYGKPMLEYIDSYINEVANPNANKVREKGSELLHLLRGKTAPAYLGWKFSGIVKQGLTSPWPYMQFVNPAEYLSAATKCWTSGGKMYDAIKDKSAYMASRVMDPINELVDEMAENAKGKVDKAWSKFAKTGMQGLEWIDWTCVAPGWLACYQKEYNRLQNMSEARYQEKVNELTEKNMTAEIGTSEWMSREQIEAQAKQELMDDIETAAVRYADDCTRACQPSSRATDLAPLFKNSSEAMKAFLQFQTSLNVIWQNIRYDIPYNIRQKQFKQIVGTICGYIFAGIFMNSVMDGVRGDDDDDEMQALRNLVFYSTTQFTDAIPMLGSDITNMMDKVITGKASFAQSGTDMTPSATKLMSALQKTTQGDFKKAAALTAEGIGLGLGAPVSGTKEVYRLLGKPLSEGDVNLKRGVGDVYGLAGDIIGE